jgi:hypothetical protein
MTPKAKDDTLYIGDNGAVACGKHLGASARYTLRDISGQRVTEVTPAVAKEATEMGMTLACEGCGKAASLLIAL